MSSLIYKVVRCNCGPDCLLWDLYCLKKGSQWVWSGLTLQECTTEKEAKVLFESSTVIDRWADGFSEKEW